MWNAGKQNWKSNSLYIIIQHIFAYGKHISYFCPAAELQSAGAATELSITQHLEQQSAWFVKLLLQRLNGARAQLHRATLELPALFSLLFESAIKGQPFQEGLEAISLLPQRFRKKIHGWFFHGRVLPVLAVWLFSKYWHVSRDPHMSRSEAAINHVWLQKCNKHVQQTIHAVHARSGVQRITKTHTRLRYAHVHLFSLSLDLALRHTTTQVWWEKELLSGSVVAKNTVASVIQAAENAQITTPSPELQLACYEGLGKKV